MRKAENKIKKILLFTLLLFGLLGVSDNLQAITKTWDRGANSSNWNDGNNWNPNGVPADGDDVIINIDATISVNTNPHTLNSLTISNSATVSLTSSGGGRTITIDNSGSSIDSGSSLTLQGSAGNKTRSMSIVFTGADRTMSIAGSLILTAVGEGTIFNATNSLTTVTGSIVNDDSGGGTLGVITSTTNNLSFSSGGTYTHALNGGNIPTATWNANSTCTITGCTDTSPGGLNQTFGNFVLDSQRTTWVHFSPTSMAIQGNLEIKNTDNNNGNSYDFSIEQDLTIGGNLIVSGGAYRIAYSFNKSLTVNGNLIIIGGALTLNSSNTNSAGTFIGTINVNGNVSITGGTLNLSSGDDTGDNGILNVKGNFSHTAGAITETGSATGCQINFNGSSKQTFTSGGTITGDIRFTVNANAYLQMAAEGTTITGGGTFTVANGGTLGIKSANGITTTGTASGNIQVTGNRTFNTGANYTYNGTVAQAAGNGLPSTVNNLTIDNTAGVTLNASPTVTSNLSLTNGVLRTGIYTVTSTTASRTNGWVHGNLRLPVGTGSPTKVFYIGDAANYTPVSLVFSGVTTSGNITASTTGSDHPNIGTSGIDPAFSLNRYWSLVNAGVSGFTSYNATFTFVPGDIDIGAEYALFLAGRYSASTWSYPVIGTITPTSVQAIGLTAFGDFQLGESIVQPTACLYGDDGSIPTVSNVIPCINIPSNPQTVSTTFTTHQYFTMNVIKGLTYQVYTCNTTSPANPLMMSVYKEGAPSDPVLAFSYSNTGNPCTNVVNNVYSSFTPTFSGQVRVLINRKGNCSSSVTTGLTVMANVSAGANTQDDQSATGANTWIGHIYDGTNAGILFDGSFLNYLGSYTQSETFNETFGGSGNDTYCFIPINSNGINRASILTVTYSVRYRMTSSKRGLWIATIGSDDGTRLSVDGSLIYGVWSDRAYNTNTAVLMNLTGSSSLVLDFYENAGGNQISFQTLTQVLANNLTANTTQNLCLGSSGSAIGGDIYGTLPTGITLSGTGYQWTYSTTPSGTRTTISGATGATFTPNTVAAPFNTPGTYYIFRNAVLSSTNNIAPNPYIATNESNAAKITINSSPTVSAGTAFAKTCTANTIGAVIGETNSATATYLWSPAAGLSSTAVSNPTANPTVTTTYTVTKTTIATGCTAQASVIVTVNTTVPTVSAGSAFTKTCISNPSGKVIGETNDATATYLWSPATGLSSSTVSNPTANPTVTTTYTITKTNIASGCTTQASVIVTVNNTLPTVSAGTAFTKTCTSNTSGAVIGEANDATATYLWSPATGLSSATISNPTANPSVTTTYTVTKTRTTNGCTAQASVIVTVNNTPPTVSAGTAFTKTCVTNPSGAAIGEANDATSTYLWSPATGLSSTTLSNPTANPTVTTTYTVTKTNTATGCTAQSSIAVTVNTAVPTVSAGTAFTKTCISNPSGKVIGESNDATATYLWSPATGLSSSTVSNPTANPTVTTTYTITKTNIASGCTTQASVIVTVNNTPPTVSAGTAFTKTCTSNASGAVVGEANDAAATYLWSPATGLSSATVSNPTANPTVTTTYTVTKTSTTNGCTAQASVIVTVNNTPPTVSAGTAFTKTCVTNPSGTAIGEANDATSTYLWSPATGLSSMTVSNPTANPTVTTTYTVIKTTTATGCTAQASVTITVNTTATTVSAGAAFTKTCLINQSGAAIGETNDATATYLWSPATGLSSATLSNPTANPTVTTTYTVTKTNIASGCAAQASVIVTVNATPPTVSAGTAFTKTCTANTSGAAIGEVNDATATYSWSPAAGLSSTIVSNPTANPTVTTTYTVTKTATATGCTAPASVIVAVNTTVPTVSAGSTFTKTCISYPSGKAIGETNDGTATYSWSPATGLSSTTVSNPTANPIITTTYTVTKTNTASGCTAQASVIVTVNITSPTVSAGSPFTKTCTANTSGAIIGETNDATATYLWSPATGLSSATLSNPTANPTVTTTYTVTKTNTVSGCSSTASVIVTVNATPPTVSAGTAFTKTCTANTSGAAIGEANDANATYFWSPTTGLSSTTVSNPTANPTVTTTYTVTKTNTASGCTAQASVAVAVNTTLPTVSAGSAFTKTCISNPSGKAIGETNDATATYLWSPATGLSSATVSNPIANPTVTTTYTVTKTNTASGCTAQASVAVTVNTTVPTVSAGSAFTKTCISNPSGKAIGEANDATATYLWNPATGLSSATVSNPTANPTVTTTYTVTKTNTVSGCSSTASVIVTVNITVPTVSITGSTSICAGNTSALSPTSGGTWVSNSPAVASVTNGGVVTGLTGGSSSFTFTQTSTGCSNTTLAITVNGLPAASGPISGLSAVSPGQANVAYSVGAISGATGYVWTYSGTGATITGTGNAVTISFSTSTTPGNLTVYGTNTCGNGSVSVSFPIVINAPTGSIAVNRKSPENTYTPEQLVQNLLVKGCLKASNVTFTGDARQIGHFTKGTSSFPINEGIILSTGKVTDAEGPNRDYNTFTAFNANAQTSYFTNSYDVATLEFDFVPAGNTMEFNYVFASEEYAEYVMSNQNDAFAFLLSGPGINGVENIALIPGTTDVVSINTVHGYGYQLVNNYPTALRDALNFPTTFGHTWTQVTDNVNGFYGTSPNRYYYRISPTVDNSRPPDNAAYYVDNGHFTNRFDLDQASGRRKIEWANGNGSSEMEFDGRTTLLTASHAVTACQTYHIKMVLIDRVDAKWDSGVLLEGRSFTSNEVQIQNLLEGISGDNSDMYEGCVGSYIRFSRAAGTSNTNPLTFNVILSGTAQNGVDYVYTNAGGTIIGDGTFPTTATIPSGQNYVEYYYKALSDGMIEGKETVLFQVDKSCPCDPVKSYFEKSVNIIDVPQIQTSTVSVIQCVGSGNPVAVITVNMQSGLNPGDYQFSLDGAAFQSNNVFTITSTQPDGSDIVGTSHSVTVRDGFSCNEITENNIIIPAITPFLTNAGSDITMCAMQTGVQLSASGGMFYTWTSSPVNGINYLSAANISNPMVSSTIPAGTYTFTVTAQDQPGTSPICQGVDNMVLTVNQRPTVTATANNYSVCSATAVQLNAVVTNGGNNPAYFWSPSANLSSTTISNPVFTPSVNSYLAQAFTVTVTNNNGCPVSVSTPVVEVFPAPAITTVTILNASCGSSNGSVTVSASSPGTSPVPPFTYSWNTIPVQSTATATNLAAGTYTVTVTDVAHGCSNTKQVTVGTFADTTPPTAVCQNISVTLDGTGNATITPSDINNGSSDNCTATGSLILSLSKTLFNTSNIGANTLVLTVKDAANNASTCNATVTVNYPTSCTITGTRTIYKESFGTGTVNGGYTISGGTSYNILNQRMRVTTNTNTSNFWLSRAINISSYTNMNISASIMASNGLDNPDYIQFWYSINGGAFVQFVNNGYVVNDNNITACTNVPNGSTVQIKILSVQDGGTEWREFDDVTLTGDPAMEAIATITNVSCYGGNNGAINMTVTKGVVPYTYAWTTSNGSGLVAKAKDQTGLTAGTYNLVVTDANLVASNPFVYTITQPATDPAINTGLAISDATSCNPAGGNIIFTITNAVSGIRYELKTTAGASLSPAVIGTGTGSNLNLTLLQANIPVTTTTYKVVATSASGCITADLPDRPTLTVYTTPAPTGAISQSYCSASSQKISNLSVTGSNIIWYNASTGGNVLTGTTLLVDGTTYYASQTLNGCESAIRLAVTVTVSSTPSIVSVTHGERCGPGSVILQASVTIGTISWYSASSGGSALGTGTTFTTPTISTSTSYWVDATNFGCTTSIRSQVYATVYASPAVILGSNPVVCIGATTANLPYSLPLGSPNRYSVNFDLAAKGAGFLDVTNAVLPASPIIISVPGVAPAGIYNATLNVKNLATGCTSINYLISVTVNANTAITIQPSVPAAICGSAGVVNLSVTATGGNLAYQWFVDGTTALTTVAPYSGVTSSTLTITNPAVSLNGKQYTVKVLGACGSQVTSNAITLTVSPKPAVNNLTSTICSAGTFTYSPATGTDGIVPVGTTYTWSAPVAAGITGLAAGTNAANISGVLTNTTNTAINVVYTVTPTSGTCTGSNFTVSVTVSPKPAVTNMTATICSAATFTSAPVNSTNGIVPAGTTYTWSAPVVAGITGTAAGTNAVNISGTLINTTNAAINVVYTVTPTSGTCTGSTFTVTVTVSPKPAVTNMTATICSAATFTSAPVNSTNGIVPAGTTYTWSAPVVAGITGTAAGTNAVNISGTLINTTNAAINVVYTVTPTSGTCTGATFTVTVTVSPKPAVTNMTATVCSGGTFSSAPATGTDGIVPAGTTYTWAAPVAAGITGLAAGNNVANISGTLINTTNAAINVIYTATPISGSCTGAPFTVTVSVSPKPAVTNMTATVCSGGTFSSAPANGTDGIVPAGTTYTWAAPVAAGITGLVAGNNLANISGTLINTTNAAINVIYTATPISGSCTGSNFTVSVTVSPKPAVTNMTATICSAGTFTSTPVNATNGIVPAGTIYSWAAPVVAGITGTAAGTNAVNISGTLTNTTNAAINVVYTVTPSSGTCTGAAFTVTVTVSPKPAVTNMTTTICSAGTFTSAPVNSTNGIVPAGTTYTWAAPVVAGITGLAAGNNVANISGTLINTTNAAINVIYTATPISGSCTGSNFTVSVTVSPKPAVTNMTATICSAGTFTSTPANGTDGIVPAGTKYTWAAPVVAGITGLGSGTNAVNISGTLINTTNAAINVVYTITPTSGSCSGSTFTVTVTVSPKPAVTNMTATICSAGTFTSAPVNGTNGIVPAGTAYTWAAPVVAGITGLGSGTNAVNIRGTLINTTNAAINVVYTVTPASGSCAGNTFLVTVTVNPDGSWTGAVNTDWNNPGNWACNQLPSIATNVLIANGKPNYPTLSSGNTGTSKNLTIESSASVTVNGNTLQIAGSISNSGSFTATNGTIEMKGSVAQTIGANVFAGNTIMNLTISNSSGATLQGPLNVTGIVTAINGNLTSGGNLTLVSTSAQTALIDGIGAGDVLGNVNMQRYLPSAFGYKYFSSPFQAATVNEFSSEVNLSAAFPNFYKYDENNSIDSSGITIYPSGWIKYNDTSNSLIPLTGYAANFGPNPAATAITANMTGVVNNGYLQTALYNHNRKYTKGFNLVGNPYPSPIDWNASGWTKNNIDNALYFFNASGSQYSGAYSSYVNGVSTGNATNVIAAMQGFFVHVSNGNYPVSATLGLTNSVRINNLNPVFKRAFIDNRTILRFTANFETNIALDDAAVIYFDNAANLKFDQDMDALKMSNTDLQVPNLYTLTPELRQLSINGMPYPTDSLTVIPIGITTLADGWINFKAKDISQLPTYLKIYLVDTEIEKPRDLNQYPDYRFYLKSGEYNRRFSLVFSFSDQTEPLENVGKMFTLSRSGNILLVKMNLPTSTKGNLMVTNILGQIILRRGVSEKETVEISQNVTTGVYVVTLISGKKTFSEKIIMRNDYE